MKLRAIITIDIEASDFVDAADHQRQLEGQLAHLRALYPGASLMFRERRAPAGSRGAKAAGSHTRPGTGRLSDYVD
jgi:hypothetical protein